MPTPLTSRFVHLEVRVDAEDWCAWGAANGIAAEVLFFVQLEPTLLHQFDPQSKEKAFPWVGGPDAIASDQAFELASRPFQRPRDGHADAFCRRLDLAVGDMCVAQRHARPLVTEQARDDRQRDAPQHRVACRRMTKIVQLNISQIRKRCCVPTEYRQQCCLRSAPQPRG